MYNDSSPKHICIPLRHNSGDRSLPLQIPRHRTTEFKGGFPYSATKCWNNLPPSLSNLVSHNTFKSKVSFVYDIAKSSALYCL